MRALSTYKERGEDEKDLACFQAKMPKTLSKYDDCRKLCTRIVIQRGFAHLYDWLASKTNRKKNMKRKNS